MLNEQDDKIQERLMPVISKLILVIVVLVIGLITMPFVFYYSNQPDKPKEKASGETATTEVSNKDAAMYWMAPDVSTITDAKQQEMVEYGKELICKFN